MQLERKVNTIKRKTWQLHLLMIPGMLFVIVFCYLPIYGITIAFKDFIPSKGILGSPWVGLEHFSYMMKMPDVWNVIRNTVIIAGLKVILGFPIPILFALLLNEIRHSTYKRCIQTIIYLPNFLSWVILSGIIIDVFSLNNGIVNQLLGVFGIGPIYFLGDNRYFRGLLISTDIWKGFGLGTVIYLASITGIDPCLYESSYIDGANRWKQTLHITLPGMLPIITLIAILNLGNVLNAGFEQIFNLYNPMVYQTSDILDTFVYRLAFNQGNFSLSAAVGLFRSVVSMIFISSGYWLVYKYTDYRVF